MDVKKQEAGGKHCSDTFMRKIEKPWSSNNFGGSSIDEVAPESFVS